MVLTRAFTSVLAAAVLATGLMAATPAQAEHYTQIWDQQIGGAEADLARDVAIGPEGNRYVVGTIERLGEIDSYIRGFGPGGDHLFDQPINTTGDVVAYAVTVDHDAVAGEDYGIYVGGYTYGSLKGKGVTGDRDGFAQRYDPTGAHQWTALIGSTGSDGIRDIARRGANQLLVVGWGRDFPNAGIGGTHAGGADWFVATVNADSGHVSQGKQWGTAQQDVARAIHVEGTVAYVSGWTQGDLYANGTDQDTWVARLEGPLWMNPTHTFQTTVTGTEWGSDVTVVDDTVYYTSRRWDDSDVLYGHIGMLSADTLAPQTSPHNIRTDFNDVINSVTEHNGNLLISGYTFGSLATGAPAGMEGTNAAGADGNYADAFVLEATVAPVPSVLWSTQFGIDHDDAVTKAVGAPDGSISVVGYTEGHLAGTNRNPGDALPDATSLDGFVRTIVPSPTDPYGPPVLARTLQQGTDNLETALTIVAGPGGTLYSGGRSEEGGWIRATSPDTGATLWTSSFGSTLNDSVLVVTFADDGTLYLLGHSTTGITEGSSGGAVLRRIEPDTGATIWSAEYGHAGNQPTAMDVGADGTIYIAAIDDAAPAYNTLIWAIDPVTRSVLWDDLYDSGGNEFWPTAIAEGVDGDVYVSGQSWPSGWLRRIDADTHEDAWMKWYDDQPVQDIVIDDTGTVFMIGSTSADSTRPGQSEDMWLRATDPTHGATRWVVQDGGTGFDSGRTIALGVDGQIYTAGVTASGLAAVNAGKTDVWLRASDPVSGATRWTTQTGSNEAEWVNAMTIAPNGTISTTGYTIGAFGDAHFGASDSYIQTYVFAPTTINGATAGPATTGGDTAITVGWDGSDANAVTWTAQVNTGQSCVAITTPGSCTITGLEPDNGYLVTLTAQNAAGAVAVEFGASTSPFICDGSLNHPFTDVADTSFADADIACIYELGVTTGTSATTYSPANNVTREQMGAFLARLYRTITGETCEAPHPFTDVPANSFATSDIGCIYELGVTTGTSATTYSPANNVTREQMGAFLARLYRTITGETCEAPHPFTDVPANSFATSDIGCIYELGVTTGTSATTYSPANNVTREQMGAFLARLYRTITES